jgi:hypothetical protein
MHTNMITKVQLLTHTRTRTHSISMEVLVSPCNHHHPFKTLPQLWIMHDNISALEIPCNVASVKQRITVIKET